MKTLACTIAFILLTAFSLEAQNYRAVPASGQKTIIDSIDASRLDCKTLKASFVQTKELSFMESTLESSGKLYFTQPQSLRWEYLKPSRFVFVLSGDKIVIENATGLNRIDANSSRTYKELSRLMVFGLSGSSIADNKDFEYSLSEGDTLYRLSLRPTAKGLKTLFKSIDLFFDKAGFRISGIDLIEPGGDSTKIRFIEQEYNCNVDQNLFML